MKSKTSISKFKCFCYSFISFILSFFYDLTHRNKNFRFQSFNPQSPSYSEHGVSYDSY